ncbi:MAG: ABC transporter ATP-binding protein [Geothrix sp.]|jgi:putative ABC transport system ATP-binding protein|nr:ABC transporter ATP-binding protein [Geothrix sp.]
MLLQARGIVKRYGTRTVLGGVDLAVRPGERVALLGPSGCGKSTLLNLLGGMDRPDAGSLSFQGEDLALARPARLAELRREKIGTIFQFFHLIPSLTARENVELPLRLLRRPGIRGRAQGLLDAVGMASRSEAWPAELSGGEMQRIAVARALAAAPALLLADEPTGNLDRESGEAVLALLSSLSEREGAALVLVTHSETAAAICHRRLRLFDGRLQGEP